MPVGIRLGLSVARAYAVRRQLSNPSPVSFPSPVELCLLASGGGEGERGMDKGQEPCVRITVQPSPRTYPASWESEIRKQIGRWDRRGRGALHTPPPSSGVTCVCECNSFIFETPYQFIPLPPTPGSPIRSGIQPRMEMINW